MIAAEDGGAPPRARPRPAPPAAARAGADRGARGGGARGAPGARRTGLDAAGVYTPEKRPFRPHVTVARLRPRTRAPRRAELRLDPLEFRAEAVTLYVSRLHPQRRALRAARTCVAALRIAATLSRPWSPPRPGGPFSRAARARRAARPPERRRRRVAVALVRRFPRGALRLADRPARPQRHRSGLDRPAHRPRRPQLRPDADVPLRRPGRRRAERDARASSAAPAARGPLPADRLRPARHRALRAVALPAARARPAPA